jgi:TolA-binding protein
MRKDTIEQKVYGWVTDVGDRVGAERISGILGSALVGVARTKARLDKNVDALLSVANIPSRADYRRMQSKLDSLQGSVMSLSRTVEQLRAALEQNGSRKRKSAVRAKASSVTEGAKARSNGRGRTSGSTSRAKAASSTKSARSAKATSRSRSHKSPRTRG